MRRTPEGRRGGVGANLQGRRGGVGANLMRRGRVLLL